MSNTLWRIAGALALTHVVLMLVGVMIQSTPSLDEGRAGIEQYYADRDPAPILTGGTIEVLGFVCLVPVLVFLGRAVGRRTEAGRWAAQTAVAAGVAYVAVTVGSGFAPGAASLWGTHHGLDLDTALALNNVRNFAYFLSLALLGAHAIGFALAALDDRWSPRWAGWGGLGTGLVLLAAVPGAALGLQDYATLVWLVWWVGLAVLMLRYRAAAEETAPEPVAVRHA